MKKKTAELTPFLSWQPLTSLVLVVKDGVQFQCLEQISAAVFTKRDNEGLCCIRKQLFETVEDS